jgi:hypothetical protein
VGEREVKVRGRRLDGGGDLRYTQLCEIELSISLGLACWTLTSINE